MQPTVAQELLQTKQQCPKTRCKENSGVARLEVLMAIKILVLVFWV
jgi:hypothetical protein